MVQWLSILAHHDIIIDSISRLISSISVLVTSLTAIISAILSTRLARKKATSECDDRIAELAKAYREGIKLADSRPKVRKTSGGD